MSDNVGYDKQDPNAWLVGIAVVTILLFTFISGFVIQAYFETNQREMYEKRVMNAPNEQRDKLWKESEAGMKKLPQAMNVALADIKAKAAQPASAPVAPKKK